MFAETGWKSNKKTKPKIFDRIFLPQKRNAWKIDEGIHEHYNGDIGNLHEENEKLRSQRHA